MAETGSHTTLLFQECKIIQGETTSDQTNITRSPQTCQKGQNHMQSRNIKEKLKNELRVLYNKQLTYKETMITCCPKVLRSYVTLVTKKMMIL